MRAEGIGTVSPSPWYPMLEIVPPGRVTLTLAASGLAVTCASIDESKPFPLVRCMIASTGSSLV